MSLIGISTRKLRGADSSTTADVAEMKIVSQPKAIAKTAAGKETSSLKHRLQGENQKFENQIKEPLTLQGARNDQPLEDRRKAACFLTSQEIAANSTEDIITTEATEFAVNSFTQVVMETRTTLKRSKNAKASATMPLVFAIWLHYTADALKTSQNGTTMRIVRNAKNLSLADATEIKITLTTKDRARMPANTIVARQKLTMHQPQGHES